MKNFLKGKAATVVILLATFVLAGIAIFTAIRLYQLRSQPVAPNVPSSRPRAQEASPNPAAGMCSLSFTLTVATASPSASPTATASGTPIATGTPNPTGTPGPAGTPNSCGGTCGSNFNCAPTLFCYNGFCRNPSCSSSANCVCSGTSTTAPAGTPKAAAPSLPESGTDWPTILGVWFGAAVILGSLLLAL